MISERKGKIRLVVEAMRHTPARDSCWRCAHAGCDVRALPSRDFAGRASPVRLVVHRHQRRRPFPPRLHPHLRSAACHQRDLTVARAALVSRRQRTRPARCAGAAGTVELVVPANQAESLTVGKKKVSETLGNQRNGDKRKVRGGLTYRLPA